MEISGVSTDEFKQIQAMHSGTYILPENPLDSLLVKTKAGQIIAYGSIQPIMEATVVINPAASDRKKLEGINTLFECMYWSLRDNKIPSVYAFVENIPYAEWLQRKHGFQKIKGQALVLDVNGSVERS